MCGRFALYASAEELEDTFDIMLPGPVTARYNIAPGQQILAVRRDAEGREATRLRWGLVPAWAKAPATGYRLINARSEGVTEKPAFRNAFRRRRCLIPASGFYEWTAIGQGRVPYYIRMKDDCLFAFAGLYDEWHDAAGPTVTTCAVITTEPNEVVRPIHDRMPAILREGDEEHWLSSQSLPAAEIAGILAPYPAKGMEAYPVSTAVNSTESEGERLIQRAGGWW